MTRCRRHAVRAMHSRRRAVALAAVMLLAGCGESGARVPLQHQDLPQLDEEAPQGWVSGSLSGVHVFLDALPWLGSAVVSAERPTGGVKQPPADFGDVGEQELRPEARSEDVRAVQPRVALRLPASTPVWRLMSTVSGLYAMATPDDVWIACRNRSSEPGWVRLPILQLVEDSTLSWQSAAPGEEVVGARLVLLPSAEPLARLQDRDGKIAENEVWDRITRLVPIGEGYPRIVRVWLPANLALQQALATLRKVEAATDASLVVTLSN